MSCQTAQAEQQKPRQTQYSFIDKKASRLEIPGDTSRLKRAKEKMEKVLLFGKGRFNIVHIGGSHVQADAFSNRVRMRFAEMQPMAGAERGAIFPWSAAKTNGPQNMQTYYTGTWKKTQNSLGAADKAMGIMGYTITTTDTGASIGFELNAWDTRWTYNRLRVFAEIEDSITTMLLVVNGDTLESKTKGGCYEFETVQYETGGKLIFRNSDNCQAEVSILGLIPENDRNGITYHSLGVNGASLASWLKCTEFDNEIKYLKPDLVIFGVGINDANVPYNSFSEEVYKERYRQLIEKIRKVNPQCVFVFITNNDCVLRLKRKNRGVNRNTPRVEQAMRELAKEYNGAVWNQFRVMGGLGSADNWVKAGLMNNDKIHFTYEGYCLLGDMMYEALMGR